MTSAVIVIAVCGVLLKPVLEPFAGAAYIPDIE